MTWRALPISPWVAAAAAALVTEAKKRIELMTKRRATLSPWESRLNRPKATEAILVASRAGAYTRSRYSST